MKDKENLNIISGWLAFFIFVSLFISPILQFFILLEYTSITDILDGIGMISLFILMGLFLKKKKPYAVKFSKILLITILATNTFALISLGPTVFSPVYLISPFIWMMYIYNSERVRAVYGSLKETKKGLQSWPILGIIYSLIMPTLGIIFSIVALINISKNRKLKGIGLSITALILGVIALLFYFGYALMGSSFDYIPEDIEISCSDYCDNMDSATQYTMEYSPAASGFMCYCWDDFSEIVNQKIYLES
jgi:hypothetical protein